MPLSYSCFISYRRDSVRIAKDFQDALETELSLLLNLPVYRDEERLEGGDFFNNKLEQALCRSACMVMIYIPKYFDEESTYCAREFKAMELLEEDRLTKLKAHGIVGDSGLIIPIIYRGRDFMPVYVSGNRNYYDFESYYLGGRTYKRKEYLLSVKQIANYIFNRCIELNSLSVDPCNGCETFSLPREEELDGWLDELLPPHPIFPGREA
jgi:hypothetical protein